jgi:hypothetical protein
MKKTDRRKFLVAGISLTALWTTMRFWKQPEKKKTMKFLTQDGKLVEIDVDKIPKKKLAANKSDFQNWVVKNKQL